MKTRLFFKFVQATLFVTATWGIGAATAHAAPCSVPTVAHPMIQSAVSDPGCDPINVAPGPYTENVIISRSLTLNGAQPSNAVAGRTFGGLGESTVIGMITIQAANVTIDGFSLTNPNQSTGILIKTAGSGALIVNNIISRSLCDSREQWRQYRSFRDRLHNGDDTEQHHRQSPGRWMGACDRARR